MHCIPVVLSQETKLWKQTANVRTIGIPNNEGMRRQPPLGEVGEAKVTSTEISCTGQEAGKCKEKAALHHATSAQTRHDGN